MAEEIITNTGSEEPKAYFEGQSFFANTNYDDNPQEGIELVSLYKAGGATYDDTLKGELPKNVNPIVALESNYDEMLYPQIANRTNSGDIEVIFKAPVVKSDESASETDSTDTVTEG